MMNMSARELAEYFRPPTLASYKVTGVLGTLAALENIFILLVYFRSKRLLKSSALVIALTLAHALNGAIHGFAGFWPQFYDGKLVTSIYCVKAIWPEVFVALYQLLPILLALNSIERLLALVMPVWYRSNCTPRRLWQAAGVTGVLGVLMCIANGIKGWLNDGPLIAADCVPPEIFGMDYMVYGVHLLAILGGLVAIVCTSIGVYKGRVRIAKLPKNSQNEINRVHKQLRLTKCLLMMSVLDVICVVIPNIILELYNKGILNFPLRYVIYPVIIYCSDSNWNILAFIMFNTEFRRAAEAMLSCKKESDESRLFISVNSQRPSGLSHNQTTRQRVAVNDSAV